MSQPLNYEKVRFYWHGMPRIDVSKSSFDAAIFTPASGDLHHQQFKNINKGFTALLQWSKSIAPLQDCLFCMEDTGSYSYGLAHYLTSVEADLCLESAYRIKHSMGIQRGKTDKADAEMIARFACRFMDELTLYTPPVAAVAQLKTLLSFRLRLIKQKTSAITAIEANKQLQGYVDVSFVLSTLNRQLKVVKEQIKQCDQQIKLLIQQDQQLHHQNKLLCSVPGVGKVIAAQVIAYTYGFTKFKDWRNGVAL